MFFQEQTSYNSLDEHSVDDPEEYRYELRKDKAEKEELDNEFQGDDDEDTFVDD